MSEYSIFVYCSNCDSGKNIKIPKGVKKKESNLKNIECPVCGCFTLTHYDD